MKHPQKILLLKVPEIDFTEKKINYSESLSLDAPPIPLGVAGLSAYLKKMTPHQVYLSDIFEEGFNEYKINHNREIFLEIAERQISAVQPDVIGISALMIINYKWVHQIARVARRIQPNVKVIVGGGYASILPQNVLEDQNVDFVVMGEGEEVLKNIIDSEYDRKKLIEVDGIGFRSDSGKKIVNRKMTFIKDIDSLPFFDWEGIKLENYMKHHKNRFVSYITSRGCPFGCSFCSSHLLWGEKFRPFSAKRVLSEIDYLVKKYNIQQIEFNDDNLTLDKRRILDILNGFIDKEYHITWTNPNAVSIATLDENVIEAMKKSGCEVLHIALESGSKRVIKEIIHGKPVSKEKAKKVCEIAKNVGLNVRTAFIIGFPGETRKEMEETKSLAMDLKCDWNQISIATPFPGTEMYQLCEKNGYFIEADSDLERYRYGFANITTEEFDARWIKDKAYEINIEVNFLKNHNFEDNPRNAVILFKDILSRYPKHLIGILCLAYAYQLSGEIQYSKDTIQRAKDLIKSDLDIYNTYKKYLDPENPIFENFFSSHHTSEILEKSSTGFGNA